MHIVQHASHGVPGISVADALRVALPAGTRVAYGHDHLKRTISWVRTLATRPYILNNIERGTLVIASLHGLTARPEIQRLPRLVEALVSAEISALVLTDDAPEVSAAAEAANAIPVLVLPEGSSLPVVERAVAGLIVDRESQVQRRSAEIYQDLIQLALEDVPIQSLAEALAEAAGRLVYVEDEYGSLQAVAAPSGTSGRSLPSVDEATSTYSARQVLGFSGEAPWAFGNRLIKRLVDQSEYEVYSAPVTLGGAAAGFLTLLGPADEMEDFDEQLATKGASAFAIPIAKQRAVVETQTRIQGSFLESLFSGGVLNEEEIAERARYLGHNLHGSYQTACIALDTSHNGLGPAREAERATMWASFLDGARRDLLGEWPKALLKDRGEMLALLVPSVGEEAFDIQILENVRARLRNLAGGSTVTMGIGRFAAGPREIVRSYLQAEQAARIGRRFLGGDQIVSFAALGAYRLLASIEDRDALTAFCDEYLGALETYDARSNAELVETLEGFFRANGNHARAAETLHLHRNTLLYRLGRVEALTGRNLDDPETRLCFQLALKIRHLTPTPAVPGKEFS